MPIYEYIYKVSPSCVTMKKKSLQRTRRIL